MIEYWLQKKSLGGWSTVTWYSADELAVAQTSFKTCVGKGMSGFSWRLVSVTVVEQAMLDEVTEIEAPELPHQKPSVANPKPVANGWGDTKSGWDAKLNPEQQADVNNAWGNFKTCNTVSASKDHGLIGSVWLIHHKQKSKVRVKADEVDRYLVEGYERGGPKTKFRE